MQFRHGESLPSNHRSGCPSVNQPGNFNQIVKHLGHVKPPAPIPQAFCLSTNTSDALHYRCRILSELSR